MKLLLKGLILVSIVVALGLPAVAEELSDPVGEKLRADFPTLMYTEIKPTPIANMYEVIASGQIFYYFPDSSHLMFGALIDKAGTNLTDLAKAELQARMIEELPLDKAVKIGHGPTKVIEVTDPDCPYCRKASDFFADKDELVTRYVFFFPLMDIHPDAVAKAAFVLSSEDRAVAYHAVMSGMYDTDPLPAFEDNQLLEDHLELTGQLGVRSTPQFWIGGEHVEGANISELERLITPPKTDTGD